MPMPLDIWQATVSRHLDLIEAGAEMAARHAEQLPLRPAFETRAESELAHCETVLARALDAVRRAQIILKSKAVDQ
ncbi:hypothetical protein ABID65_006665 [Bradyrhizobium sp. S3.9.2]|uniref:hypothetical protein n=1 Tax=Bradyrhizobium sp. S3.9.2 TaxID=3156432 RepID=UPI0033920CBD